jgi:hypothetical protein
VTCSNDPKRPGYRSPAGRGHFAPALSSSAPPRAGKKKGSVPTGGIPRSASPARARRKGQDDELRAERRLSLPSARPHGGGHVHTYTAGDAAITRTPTHRTLGFAPGIKTEPEAQTRENPNPKPKNPNPEARTTFSDGICENPN